MSINVQLFYTIFLALALALAQETIAAKPSPPPLTLTLDDVQAKYNKKYKNEEEKAYRKLVLESNKKNINEHNKKGVRNFQLNENQFIDLTPEEFVRTYTGLISSTPAMRQYVRDYSELKVYEAENCNCVPGYDLRKMDLEKRVAKNSAEYSKGIEKHLAKNAAADSKNPFSQGNSKKSSNNLPSILASLLTGGLNQLSSLSSPILGLTNTSTASSSSTSTTSTTPTTTISNNFTNIDWTNMSGPVRAQGACGACYAFTTVQVLEAANAIYTFNGTYIQLSVQQVIDCAVTDYNGCDGGLLQWSYGLMRLTGIVSAFRYPYTSGSSGVDGPCKTAAGGYKILSFRQLNGTCSELRSQLQSKPVSTAIKAKYMQFYASGIYDNCTDIDPFDHAVVVVGYNASMGWKIKNSWGLTWGISGFGWLSLDDSKNCGICVMPVVPKTYNQP